MVDLVRVAWRTQMPERFHVKRTGQRVCVERDWMLSAARVSKRRAELMRLQWRGRAAMRVMGQKRASGDCVLIRGGDTALSVASGASWADALVDRPGVEVE
jgi:hypothetical protein